MSTTLVGRRRLERKSLGSCETAVGRATALGSLAVRTTRSSDLWTNQGRTLPPMGLPVLALHHAHLFQGFEVDHKGADLVLRGVFTAHGDDRAVELIGHVGVGVGHGERLGRSDRADEEDFFDASQRGVTYRRQHLGLLSRDGELARIHQPSLGFLPFAVERISKTATLRSSGLSPDVTSSLSP